MYIVYFLNNEKVGNLTLLNSFTTKDLAKSYAVESLGKYLEKEITTVDGSSAEDVRCNTDKKDGLYAIYDQENHLFKIYEKTSATGMIFTSYYIKELGIVGVTPAPSHRTSILATKPSDGKWLFVDQITKLIQDAEIGQKNKSVILPSQLNKKKLGTIKIDKDSDSECYSTDEEMNRWIDCNDKYEETYVEYCNKC